MMVWWSEMFNGRGNSEVVFGVYCWCASLVMMLFLREVEGEWSWGLCVVVDGRRQ